MMSFLDGLLLFLEFDIAGTEKTTKKRPRMTKRTSDKRLNTIMITETKRTEEII